MHLPRLLSVLTTLLVCRAGIAQQHYTGELHQVARNGGTTPLKEFDVDIYLTDSMAGTTFYQLNEGRPALPWIERFGVVAKEDPILSSGGIAVGYRHLDRNYALPIGLPYFAEFAELSEGASWKNKQGTFEVAGEREVNGHQCWDVRCTIGIARHHQFYVRKSEPVIEAGSQTVFMGPGDRFRITFQREPEKSAAIDPDSFLPAQTALLKLKDAVERNEFDRFQPINAEQLKALTVASAGLVDGTKNSALAPFAKEITEDLSTLQGRKDRVSSLAGSMVNQTSPKYTLSEITGGSISSSELQGKPVVLHFWDYANPALEQPYGQVGYLDFLNNRWKDKGVLVYGVAVNSQLNDLQTQAKAIREIRKLKQFMKLGYDITFDGGAVLNSFGNPTRLGEELPLWVVISPEGKVAHYRTGMYEVDNRVGLKEIDDVLQKLTE